MSIQVELSGAGDKVNKQRVITKRLVEPGNDSAYDASVKSGRVPPKSV